MAVDKDSGLNSVFQYSLFGDGSNLFEIDPLQGTVRFLLDTNDTLDREQIAQYKLKVVATDLFNLSSSTDLVINVNDVNDHSPVFTHGDQSVEILEKMPPGTRVTQVIATDADAPGVNSDVSYALQNDAEGRFRVDKSTGEIFLAGTISPETVLTLNVSATDGGGRRTYAMVHVHVLDVNNHAPIFPRPDYRFEIPEGRYTLRPHTLSILSAKDEDFGNNALVEYKLDSVTDEGWPFVIDPNTGQLNITRDLDRETQASYHFVVMAVDQGVPQLSSSASIVVNVLDINDEQPRFIGDPYYASIPENQKPGYFVAQVRAYDLDSNATGNGQIHYKLADERKHDFFIDSKEGTIWTLTTLDYEQQTSYEIPVTVSDLGIPPLSATAMVYVNVTDKDDIRPNFRKSVFMVEVAENAPPGSIVYKLDAGSPKFQYNIIEEELDETFSLDSDSGEIALLRHLDSERQSRYKMLVQASDKLQSDSNDTAEVILLVSTGPALRVFPKRDYKVQVRENLPAPVVILDMNATEETEQPKFEYMIIGNDYNGLFTIDKSNGKLSLTKSLDREVREDYSLRVRGRKLGLQSTSEFMERRTNDDLASDEAFVTIKVEDENDNIPEFGTMGRPLVTVAPVHASFGHEIVTIKAKDSDAGSNGAVRYEMIYKEESSSRFQINPITGVLRALTPLALDAGKVFGLDIRATDRDGDSSGHSSYLNVMVYVISDNKLVMLSLGEKALLVEENLKDITSQLSNVTGYDVKVNKLQPHTEGQTVDLSTTDLYLYAVDPTNILVDTERLIKSLNENHEILDRDLAPFKVGRVQALNFHYKASQLSVTEVALLAFGCIVFVAGALGIFLACLRRKNRKHSSMSSNSKNALSSPLWATEQSKVYGHSVHLKDSLSGRGSRNNSMDKANYSSTIHSNPDYTTDVGSPRDSYKDSLSSVSTLDLQKARRNRQRAPSSSSLAPPSSDHQRRIYQDDDVDKVKMNPDWREEADLDRTIASDYPSHDAGPEKNWWANKSSGDFGYQ